MSWRQFGFFSLAHRARPGPAASSARARAGSLRGSGLAGDHGAVLSLYDQPSWADVPRPDPPWPWPLQPAESEVEANALAEANGIDLPEAPLVHFCRSAGRGGLVSGAGGRAAGGHRPKAGPELPLELWWPAPVGRGSYDWTARDGKGRRAPAKPPQYAGSAIATQHHTAYLLAVLEKPHAGPLDPNPTRNRQSPRPSPNPQFPTLVRRRKAADQRPQVSPPGAPGSPR